MRTKFLWMATSFLAVAPLAAHAQAVVGPYVSLGAGYNLLQDQFLHTDSFVTGIPSGPNQNGQKARYRYGSGFNSEASVGYGLGYGLRVELEGDYYYNNVKSRPGSFGPGKTTGYTQSYGPMANIFYDFDLGLPIIPYVGVGVGYQWTHLAPLTTANADGTLDRVGGTSGAAAYQGIAGFAYPLNNVLPGLAMTAEYRYLGTRNPDSFEGQNFGPFGESRGHVRLSNAANHSVMLGFRYALFQPVVQQAAAQEAVVTTAPAAVPAPEPARTYLVFFDWDRSDLTTRAQQIIGEAAQASTHVQTTKIAVNGYTDLSGTAEYNQKLSVRRAETVQAELVRDGVAKSEISIQGFGEANPLVPTAAGVREPQNRRVEIILQ